MGDISTWNPVDNSNTTAPPDGWPEGMAPSAVNNSARAMMGAVRRWYDTATAQIAGMLPLTGGTLTGTLTAPNVTASDTVMAAHLTITGNATVAGAVTAAQLTSTGNINAAGTVTGTSFIGNVSVPANGPVSTGGTVTGGQVTSTGNANVAGSMTAGSVSASSDVTAAGSVTGGSMHCQGTLQVDGQSNLLGPLYVGPGGAWARIDSSGTYNVSGSWTAFSGRAAKENIVDYDARGLAAVLALRPVAFNYRADLFGPEEAERVRYGLVAEEVAEVLPEMVGQASFGGRDISTLNTGHISIVLLNACRELAAQNAALAARIEVLEQGR